MDPGGYYLESRKKQIKFINAIVEDINISYAYWETPFHLRDQIPNPLFDKNTTYRLLELYRAIAENE